MITIQARCNGAFIGHAIASHYDPSISMAVNISESLLEYKQFNGPDILSRYLYLYHTQQCEIGETIKQLYSVILNNNIESLDNASSISRQNFLFNRSAIDESVKIVDNKLDGMTAGCGPAQRSFPLALCHWIKDEDLFDVSMQEAAITHYNRLAGQVAGIVNVICRSLLKNETWHDAVKSAFLTPRLEPDISIIYASYGRFSHPYKETHSAYAPTALHAAIHYITISRSPMEAIQKAQCNDKYYCTPIVGILSGALWSIPSDMYKDKNNDPQFKSICQTANKLSNQWPSKYDKVVN